MRQFKLPGPLTGLVMLLLATAAAAARVEQDGVVADGVGPAAAPAREAWARYRDSAALRFLDWLADGTLLVSIAGVDGARAARIAAPQAAPEFVDGAASGIIGGAAHPFDARRVALRSAAGTGGALLGIHGPDGALPGAAEASALVDTPLWAHDGRRLAFARWRSGGGTEVRVAEPGEFPGAAVVTGDGDRWDVLDWSRDDRALLLRQVRADGDERLLIAAVAGGALTPVDAPAQRQRARGSAHTRVPAARFTPDGRAVLYLRDDGEDGHVRLKIAAQDGAAPRALSPPMPHDIECFDVSGDGRYLAYSWAEGGYSRVALVDQRAQAPLPLPAELPLGVIRGLRFDRSGTRLAVEVSTATTPPEIDVVDVAAGTLERWAQAAPAGAASQPAQRFRFRTWDRSGGRPRELTAFLYTPAGTGPHPVLVLLHEDPAGQFRPGYDAWLQYVVNELRIAVVAPNLRGPDDSRRAPAASTVEPLNGAATRDFGSLLVWIGAQPSLDAKRIAVMGRGPGGRQALGALAAYGERLRGAVAIDPPADAQSLAHAAVLLRPTLLAQLDGVAGGRLSDAEQLLWRMRANRREAAYLGIDAGRCALDCRGAEGAVRATIGAYLEGLLAAAAPAAGLSATRAP